MRRVATTAFAFALLAPLAACSDPPDVKLEIVKKDELAKRLAALKGKVVVMDVWGEF
jgi:hypothetical protein